MPFYAIIFAAPTSGVELYSMNTTNYYAPDMLVASDAGNDTLHAGLGLSLLDGGTGADTLYGSTSAAGAALLVSFSDGTVGSQLFAGLGADTLYSGNGPDTLWGSTGSQSALLVSRSAGTVMHAGHAHDTLIGYSGGGDTLYGSVGASGGALLDVSCSVGGNLLYAALGNDTLDASYSTGNNQLYGGLGASTLMAGSAHDVLIGSGVSVTEYGATDSTGGAALYAGSALSAVLNGGSGTDTLYGGSGADTLIASAGAGSLVLGG